MNLSPAGEAAIERREAFRPTAYKPTKDDVWTIGYGHTRGVNEGDTCTLDQARAWFLDDSLWASAVVSTDIIMPLTQNQFDALVSLAFNIGRTAFAASSLVRELNAGNFAYAADPDGGFPAWRKQGKRVLPGLVNRRADELKQFQGD